MKRLSFVWSVLLLCVVVFAEPYDLSDNPGQRNAWWSKPMAIPKSRPGLEVRFDYICHGPQQAFVFLQFLDKDGNQIGKEFLVRPPLHYPAEHTWEKKDFHAVQALPQIYPPNAVSLRYKLTVSNHLKTPGDARITVLDSKLFWLHLITPDQFGGLFPHESPVSFTASLPDDKIGVRGNVFDLDNKLVATVDCKGSKWTFRPELPGFYQTKFSWLDANGKTSPIEGNHYIYDFRSEGKNGIHRENKLVLSRDRMGFGVIPAGSKSVPNMFGFVVSPNPGDLPLDQRFALTRALHMDQFIRLHWFRWHDIEQERGKYDWTVVDNAIAAAKRNGLTMKNLLFNTLGTPRWNSPHPDYLSGSFKNFRYFAPNDLSAWHDYIHAFVKRYPDMELLELWNEPHVRGGSVFWQESTVARFIELMKAGYEGAKEANPNITILMGGIGLRYMPFYDEFLRKGGQQYLDVIETHCGYDLTPFRTIERKNGKTSKPFLEGEWHTVLYNCRDPELPSEQEVTFRMLVHLADLIQTGHTRITGFGMTTGNKVPEAARFYAKAPGIQQISGLFRSQPWLEPRESALALRNAVDLFPGKVAPLGNFCFGDKDNEQFASLFRTPNGNLAMFWAMNDKSKFTLAPALAKAFQGSQFFDWQGRPVAPKALRPRMVYYAKGVSPDAFPKKNQYACYIDTRSTRPVMRHLVTAHYTKPGQPTVPITNLTYENCTARPMQDGLKGSFTVAYHTKGLELHIDVQDKVHFNQCDDMRFWEVDSVQFALDCVGNGYPDDRIEFAAGPRGIIYKLSTPQLKGDIPADYSEANVPLTKSTVKVTRNGNTTSYDIHVSEGDLFPFICKENIPLRFSLLINNNDGKGREGYLQWAAGIGTSKTPAHYGDLTLAADTAPRSLQKLLAHPFQDAKVTSGDIATIQPLKDKQGAGIAASRIPVTPGVRYRISFEARGTGKLSSMTYGKVLKRTDFPTTELSDKWQTISLDFVAPADESFLSVTIFFWKQLNANAQIRNLSIQGI
ncbi:MAG: hypothetical protein IJJ26_12735 [Victivallales bacterium]|nr:hypothetical protein [Victivallales bacterium]